MPDLKTRALVGALSGLFAGTVTGLLLWGMWILPALALLVTRTEPWVGFIIAVLLGVVLGLLYGLIIGRAGNRDWSAIAVGLILGVAAWALLPVVVIPLALGLTPPFMVPQLHLSTLIAFIIMGLAIALFYRFLVQRVGTRG